MRPLPHLLHMVRMASATFVSGVLSERIARFIRKRCGGRKYTDVELRSTNPTMSNEQDCFPLSIVRERFHRGFVPALTQGNCGLVTGRQSHSGNEKPYNSMARVALHSFVNSIIPYSRTVTAASHTAEQTASPCEHSHPVPDRSPTSLSRNTPLNIVLHQRFTMELRTLAKSSPSSLVAAHRQAPPPIALDQAGFRMRNCSKSTSRLELRVLPETLHPD